jgi:hypothetical protein
VARAAKEAEPYLEPLLTKPEWEGYHLDLAAALYRMDERHGAQLLTALIAKLKKAESWFCSYWDWDDFMDFLRQKGPEARVAAPYLEQLMERPKWAEFDRDRTRIAQPLLDIDPTNVKALRFILKSLQAQSTSSNPAIRSGAKERLAKLRPLAPSQVKELLRLAGDPSLRDTAHRILLNLGTDALPGLRQAAEDADEPIRKEAAAMIEAITNPPK